MGQDIIVAIKPDISKVLLRHAEILRSLDVGTEFERYHIRFPGSNSFTTLRSSTDSCYVYVDIVSDENKRAMLSWIADVVKKEELAIDEFSMRVS